jgi:tyrosine-protein kinase Etk/Wzc
MAQRDNSQIELKVAESPVVERSESMERARFPELLIVLAKRKGFIIKFVSGAVVLSLIVVLLLPKIYTATTRIMPPQQPQSLSLTALMSQLGPLGALAQGVGLHTPSEIYVSMLRSDTIANNIIERFSLKKVYGAKLDVDARRRLEQASLIVANKDGIISVSVDDKDPQRASDMANAYAEELEKLTKVLAVSEAAKRRLFFERETKLAMDDLSTAEIALKQTQEKTGLILLEPQSRAIMEALEALRARVAAKEVEIEAMRSFAAPQNPDLVRAQNELAALKQQVARLEVGGGKASIADLPIENVPTAGLEYVRKLREVKYRESLFELLAKQFEAAKIDEARDTFIVQQLDRATKPERKSRPLRAVIVVVSAAVALILAIMAAFFMEKLERAREDREFASQLQLFKFYLSRRRS